MQARIADVMRARYPLAAVVILLLTSAAHAQEPLACEEDVETTAKVLRTFWSFELFTPGSVNLGRLLAEFRPEARAAVIPDACADILERFLARVNDGHALLESYPRRTPRTYPAIVFRSLRHGYVDIFGAPQPVRVFIVDRDSSNPALRPLEPGSEVLRVNGVGIDTLYGRLHARISGSTAWWRDYVADKILLRGPAESAATMTFRTPGGDERRITVQRPPDPFGYDEEAREKAARAAEDRQVVAEVAVLEDGWGHLTIHTFLWKDTRKTAERIEAALDSLLERPGLVLDLRENHGGYIEAARRIAGRFIDRRSLIGWFKAREPGSDHYAAAYRDPKRGLTSRDRLYAEPRKPLYEGPVVVLVGAGCFSACETFAGGLQSTRRATVVGTTPSGGGSGTVTRYKLPSGAIINFSVFVSWRPDTTMVEGRGVKPDVIVYEGPQDWIARRDRVLEKAIELLEAGEARSPEDFEPIDG